MAGPGCPGPTTVDNGNALIGLIAGLGGANSNGQPDIINLEAGCTYTVTGPGSPLTITSDGGNPLTINGNGASISGGGSVRVFTVTSGADLRLNNVTIRDGRNGVYNNGGSVNISGSTIWGNSSNFGGGIFNNGTMAILNSTITGNTAGSNGGGILNTGVMTIINSTIIGNTAGNNGGGVANTATSTVSDGIVYQTNYGTLTMTNSTVARNFADAGGGLFHSVGPTLLSLRNSIVSNNFGGDCVQITHDGPNFGCDGAVAGSVLLGDFNGIYIPLLNGSAAIDTGDSSLCPATDQIGNGRNDGNGDGSVVCDLGAIEAQFTIPALPDNVLPVVPELTNPATLLPLTATPIPLHPTDTLAPPRPSDTPIPQRPTDLPIAPNDRDFALVIRAGEDTRFSDIISFPNGDTSDTIAITVEDLGREPLNYTFTLNCTGVGTEFVQWEVVRVRGGIGCGQSITVPFSAEANGQAVQILLPGSAVQGYVNYILTIAVSR